MRCHCRQTCSFFQNMAKFKPLPKTSTEANKLGLQTLASLWKLPPKKRRGRRKKQGNLVLDKILVKTVTVVKAKPAPRKRAIKCKPNLPIRRANWSKGDNLAIMKSAVEEWSTKTGSYFDKNGKARSITEFCACLCCYSLQHFPKICSQ